MFGGKEGGEEGGETTPLSNSSFKGSMVILEVFGCFKAQKCTNGVIISL
jgi:hypothetical protein